MASSFNEQNRHTKRIVARILQMHCATTGIDPASPDGYALAAILLAAMRHTPMSEIDLAAFLYRLTSHGDATHVTVH